VAEARQPSICRIGAVANFNDLPASMAASQREMFGHLS